MEGMGKYMQIALIYVKLRINMYVLIFVGTSQFEENGQARECQLEENWKVGNYVVIFRSFVEQFAQDGLSLVETVNSDVCLPTSRGPGRPRRSLPVEKSSRGKNSVYNEPAPPYEKEWMMEVDQLGRKILTEGDEKIRMPYLQIRFSVVAGPPHKFEIDELGLLAYKLYNPDLYDQLVYFVLDEQDKNQRIGQPFNLWITFTDAKDNITIPEDWQVFVSQRPQICAVQK